MTTNELEREIDNLIDAGYYVLPLRPNDKTPACQYGVKEATNDKDEAARLFTNVNPLNVGVACVNLFVLDIDVKNGKNGLDDLREMEATLGELPPAPCVETPSGGRHYYFKKPTESVKAKTKIKFKGRETNIDIRTGDSYVLEPPSEIDGKKYERAGPLIAVDDLPELPAAWLGFFKEANAPPTKTKTTNAKTTPTTKTERNPAALVPTTNDEIESAKFRCRKYLERIAPAVKGQCGGKTFFQVCNVIFNGFALSEEDGRPLLEEYNARCLPPWNLDDAQDRRYFESSITKAIKTPQRERGELFAKTNGLDGDELDATFNALVAEMNRKLDKTTNDAPETNLKETDGGGDNDADDRDDDGFLSLERQKERRKEERERRERTRQIWEAQQFRTPFPIEAVPEIVRRRIEYAERTLNAEPSGLFAAATAAASSAIGYAAQVKRSAFDAKYLSLPCVVVGPTGAGKSPLVNVMAAPFIEFGRENSVGNQGKSRVLFWTSLTPESMKAETAALRNSQYETGEMSTILYFKEEAVDIIAGCGYNKNAAARQNSAFIEAFDGARSRNSAFRRAPEARTRF